MADLIDLIIESAPAAVGFAAASLLITFIIFRLLMKSVLPSS